MVVGQSKNNELVKWTRPKKLLKNICRIQNQNWKRKNGDRKKPFIFILFTYSFHIICFLLYSNKFGFCSVSGPFPISATFWILGLVLKWNWINGQWLRQCHIDKNENFIEIMLKNVTYSYISWTSALSYKKEPDDNLPITLFHTNAECQEPKTLKTGKWNRFIGKLCYFMRKIWNEQKNYDENHTNERNKTRIFPFEMEHAFYFPHEWRWDGRLAIGNEYWK